MTATVHHGDCLEVLRTLEADSVDAVVTDPPYGLEFMGKNWDAPWNSGAGLGGNSEAGFSEVGLTDGPKRLPRPSYLGGTNGTCRSCGGSRRGKEGKKGQQPCRCESPNFLDLNGPRMRAFQEWCEQWAREVFRVLKPGAHLVTFGGTRTYHRMACAIEDAGFEIRDSLTFLWCHGQGFPKVGYIDRENLPGWAGSLKPSFEPIVLARKPLSEPTVAANVLRWSTGALAIDKCRVPHVTVEGGSLAQNTHLRSSVSQGDGSLFGGGKAGSYEIPAGRWPPNLLHSGDPEALEAFGRFGISKDGVAGKRTGQNGYDGGWGAQDQAWGGYGSQGSPARFFPALGFGEDELRLHYSAKASRAERDAGLEGLPAKEPEAKYRNIQNSRNGTREGYTYDRAPLRNTHPTVKPVALMAWLCRLVTPPGGTVLDPFLGSGSTAVGCIREGFNCIGIEREAEYIEIARGRIAHAEAGETRADSSVDAQHEAPRRSSSDVRPPRRPPPRARPSLLQADLFAGEAA